MIDGYLRPLNGTMTFAVRRGLITVNPYSLLTSDDRPHRRERRQDHVWSDAEIAAVIQAAEVLARKPASRYDYTPLLRTALFTGLRLGELLGLQWRDVDLQEAACPAAAHGSRRVYASEDEGGCPAHPALRGDGERAGGA
jgi:integrase